MTKLVFLDIDGVLNRMRIRDSRYFEPDCIREFNRVLQMTGAKVVISSSWRHMMIGHDGIPPDMTIGGFTTMLRTHGIIGLEILGHIGPDNDSRAALVRKWLNANRQQHSVERYVVLDDCEHGFHGESLPFVQTNSMDGLTADTADEVIRILNL